MQIFMSRRAEQNSTPEASFRCSNIRNHHPRKLKSSAPPINTIAIPTSNTSKCDGAGNESLEILSGLASEMTKLSERGMKRRVEGANDSQQQGPVVKHRRYNGHAQPQSTPVQSELPIQIIQDWHAVIGDKHSGNRTTTATKIFNEVKQWYKANKSEYRSQGRQNELLGDAMKKYFERVATEFPNDFPASDVERLDTILIHCSPKASESNRVRVPHCFRYQSDKLAKYGIAAIPIAVLFFFESRDAPTLEYDVSKYRREMGSLMRRPVADQPSPESIQYFESLLEFCEQQLNNSKNQDIARQFLELINLRTTLKQLWQTLKGGTAGSDSEDATRRST